MSNNQIVNELMKKSRVALKELESYTQEQVDDMCIAIGLAVQENAEILAKEAIEETGLGNYEHKVMKNFGTGGDMWSVMKGKKSVGVIDEDTEKGLIYVAHPKGVISCVAPTTNPTITPLGNAMLAIKGRNTLITAPHPRSKKVTTHTIEIMNAALRKLGAPENVLQIIEEPSIEGTQELMRMSDIVVATGGMNMVNAAYSSGKPAYGVGQGNVQHIIADDYDDLDLAAGQIVFGRSLDNGIICAGDQSVIMPKSKEAEMVAAMERNGAYYSDKDEIIQKFKKAIYVNGKLNPKTIGQSAQFIADLAGVTIPDGTQIILLKVDKCGSEELLCGEKMCPVTVALTYDTFEEAVAIAKANVVYQGLGHSAAIHTNNKEYVAYMGVNLPVSRICVNQPGLASGGAGLGNYLNPTPSLGCGSWGGNSISENLTYEHLINISRIAYPRKGNPPTREEIWSK